MNPNIKTCAKCGAKNFANFTTCFNCGSADFIENRTVERIENVQKQQVKPEQEKRVFMQNTQDAKFTFEDVDKNRQNNFSQSNAVTAQEEVKKQEPQQAPKEQPARPVFRPRVARANPEPISKLGMQAQEELIKNKRENKQDADIIISEIAKKLEGLENKMTRSFDSNINRAEIQSSVTADITKLDKQIETLKSDNRQVMDLLVRTQKEQIEKLEAQLGESNMHLLELRESKGQDKKAISYLEAEKQELERQLEAERQRFDMVLKDRAATKELSEVAVSSSVPTDYVVYTGNIEDPTYIEYAKRQFLKIYPKIISDEEHEDVIYYIPGEFKNPPVLVLNPNVTKNYARNIKLNLISGVEERLDKRTYESPFPASEGGRSLTQPMFASGKSATLREQEIQSEVPVTSKIERDDNQSQKVTPSQDDDIIYAEEEITPHVKESLSDEKERAYDENEAEEYEDKRENVTSLNRGNVHLMDVKIDDDEEKTSREENNPMRKMVGAISSNVIDSKSITELPDISQVERQHIESRSKRNVAIASVLLGVLVMLSLAVYILPFFMVEEVNIPGYQTIAVFIQLFKKDYINEFTVIEALSTNVMAPYVRYISLAMSLTTLAAALAMLIGCKKGKLATFFKFLFLFLTILLSLSLAIIITVCFPEGIKSGYGIWIKVVVDIICFTLSCVFIAERKGKPKNIEDKIKPVTIKTEQ